MATIATKEQERKALEQIKKIVEGLGKDSYVATAFEGCFADAEENINNDWACSMKGRFDSAMEELGKVRKEASELRKENARLQKNVKELQDNVTDLKDVIAATHEEVVKTYVEEHKEVWFRMSDGDCDKRKFKKIKFHNDNGFRFFNIVEPNGWTNSYKIDELVEFIVE